MYPVNAILGCHQFMECFSQCLWSSVVSVVSLVVLRITFCSVTESTNFLSFDDNMMDLSLVGNAIGGKVYFWIWNSFFAAFHSLFLFLNFSWDYDIGTRRLEVTIARPPHQPPVILSGTPELGWAPLTCGCWQINSILANIAHRNSIRILNPYPFWWKILIRA